MTKIQERNLGRAILANAQAAQVAKLVAIVEPMLGDVIDPEEMTQAAQREEVWTLCIDAANDLHLDDRAAACAKAAVKQLGY